MKEDSTSNSRRKFPRKSFRKTLSYLLGSSGEVVEGVEIGEGGISFKSQKNIALNEKIIVNFFLPDGDFYSLRTTLKNIQKIEDSFIYGLSFNEVSIPLKRQVRAYVARTAISVPMY